ncbi:MAG: S41 family peptidase [Candidatus Krumholzibacteria bacterium]|jgi:hypothetical protein|nr:S41 family peptidase [Candidatus Krumholzibacteria bacterium]
MKFSIVNVFAAAALLVASSEIDAQVYVRKVVSCGGTGQAGYTVAIDGETKLAVTDSLFQAIREGYLFSERASEVVDFIRGRISSGSYDDIFKADDFAAALTRDLRAVSNDAGFNVSIEPLGAGTAAPSCAASCPSTPAPENEFEIRKAGRLTGDIGYLEISGFTDSADIPGIVEGAMRFLSGIEAIIFDLRSSKGGSPSMAGHLAGYVMNPGAELHRLDEGGKRGSTRVAAISPPAGMSRPEIPVYVLTGPGSEPAAESFAYDLKHLGRAVVVGERTRGGGRFSTAVNFGFPRFNMIFELTTSRPVHPVTGSSWLGVGVDPDVEVPACDALAEAHKLALLRLAGQAADPAGKSALEWTGMAIRSEHGKIELSPEQLDEYAGTYGPRKILKKENALVYVREGNPADFKLVPLDRDLFGLEGIDIMRLRFERDAGGTITGLTAIRDNGDRDSSRKER